MLGKEDEIRNGLRLFKLEQPSCKEATLIQKELELLEEIWTLNKKWEDNWMQWKLGKFSELQTDDIEELAISMLKKISRLVRDNKNCKWDVLKESRDRIDQFKRTIPLIADLRNEAMRLRHWDAIRKEMG
ncbi:unnamed protein product, partial [Hymenolepis diminuta]